MSLEATVRPFFSKAGVQTSALASAYIETNTEGADYSTKVACTFFGPMQMQVQSAQGSQADACQVKVTIEFADERKSALLAQLPILEETLAAQSENFPTEAVAQMNLERRMKEQITSLSQVVATILSSAIATEEYSGTQIACSFSIVELDCDILQAMVNCASVAMLSSTIKCRFLPAAICLLQLPEGGCCVDPTQQQLRNQLAFSLKTSLVFNVDTEELVYSSMVPLRSGAMLDLGGVERLIGTGLAASRRFHRLVIRSAQAME